MSTKSNRPNQVSKARMTKLFVLLLLFVLTGCGDTILNFKESSNANFLTGRLTAMSSTSSLTQALSTVACTTPEAVLYKLTPQGDRVLPPLKKVAISANGNYSFAVKELGLKFERGVATDPLVVMVEGCSEALSRPVTSNRNQDITKGSTLLTYVLNTANKEKMANILKASPKELESLTGLIANMNNVQDAYDYLSTNPKAQTTFSRLFDDAPTVLLAAAPVIRSYTIPKTASEHVSIGLSIESEHWSSSYVPVYQWKVDGTPIGNFATGSWTPSANAQGSHVLSVTIGENNGSGSIDPTKPTKTLEQTIVVANTVLPQPPTFSITSPVLSSSPASTRSLVLTLDTGIARINCESFSTLALSEATVAPADSAFTIACHQAGLQDVPFTLTSPGDGPKVVRLWARDSAGVISASPTSAMLSLDTSIPSASITTTLAARTNSSSQTFTFTGSDNGGSIDHYECRLDSGSYSNCSTPKSYSALSEGPHTFYVRAIDTAGNTSPVESVSWIIDLTPPVLNLASTPAAITNQTSSSFTFSASDSSGVAVAGFTCQLDSSAASACISPYLSVLSAGNHTITITTTDAAGNSASQTYTWIIDTIAPTASISSGPASITNSQTASISFTGADTGGGSVSGFECQLDGAGYSPCSSPRSLSSLTAGAHSFNVRARDTAGNTGNPVSYAWTIDLTTPLASINSAPESITNATTASFTFSANPPPSGSITGYQCKLDAGSWGACTSPKSYTSLTQGAHTFGVKSVDNNGNLSSEVTHSWVVDLSAPTLSISSSPGSIVSTTTASFVFTATDTGGGSVDSYTCSLDGSAFTSCSSPKTLSGLGQGSHTFSVIALDTAGNSSTTQTSGWIVDLTAPTPSIASSPVAVTNDTTAAFTFSATDAGGGVVSSYQCSLDGASFSTCSSPLNFSSLTAGTHGLAVRALDSAGNTSSPVTYNWTIDLTAPILSITGAPLATANSNSANFTFSATDTGGGAIESYSCKLDGAAFTNCTSPKSFTSLADGTHTFSVTALDSAGNTSVVSTHTWVVDTSAPTVSITSPSSDGSFIPSTQVSSFTVGGSCSENGRAVSIAGFVTGSATCTAGAWSLSLNLSALAEGSLSITATQVDAAGNTTTTGARTFVKDTTLPVMSLTAVTAMRGNVSTGTFSWALTEANVASGASFNVELYNGTSWASVGTRSATAGANSSVAYTLSSVTIPNVDVSNARFRVSLTDAAGNTTTTTSSAFIIDSLIPTVSFTSPSGVFRGSQVLALNYAASDSGSGLDTVKLEYSTDGSSYSVVGTLINSGSSYNYTLPNSNTTTASLRLRVRDIVGNETLTTPSSFTVDSTAPAAPVAVLFTPTPTNAATASFTISSCADRAKILVATSLTPPAFDSVGWVSCSTVAGAISTSLGSGEGARSRYLYAQDAAGNVSAPTSAFSIVLDQTPPVLTLTAPSSSQILSGLMVHNVTWSASDALSGLKTNSARIEGSTNGGSNWVTIADTQTTAGPYAWDPDDSINQAGYRLRVTVADIAGNTTSVSSGLFTVDSVKPTVSSMSVAGGASSTVSSTIPVSFSGADSQTKVTHFCIKYNSVIEPPVTDACWVSLSDPTVNQTASQNITVSNFQFALGFSTGSYAVRTWVKDEAGNVSQMSNGGNGNVGTDLSSITYVQPLPIAVNAVFATNQPSPNLPVLQGQKIFNASNATAFVKWKITVPSGNSVSDIQLEYLTTESPENWASVQSGLVNGSNGGCTPDGAGTADDGYTGCYNWSAVPYTYVRMRIRVTDQFGSVIFGAAQPNNTTPFEILAGNLDMAIGGDARTTVLNYSFSQQDTDPKAVAVAPNGTIYYRDTSRGILKFDPATGTMSLHIKSGGSTSTVLTNALRTSVTLRTPNAIDIDGLGNLYIRDRYLLHKWDASTDRMTTIVGGGSQTSDIVVGGRSFQLYDWSTSSSYLDEAHHFDVLSNGDILFKTQLYGDNNQPSHSIENGGGQVRYYRASEDKVYSIFVRGGIGARGYPTLDTSKCRMTALAYAYDPNTLLFSHFHYSANFFQATTNSSCVLPNYTHAPVLLSGPADLKNGGELIPQSVADSAHPSNLGAQGHTFSIRTGKNGKIYFFSQDSGVRQYDPATNNFTYVYGYGSNGTCDDGTLASACRARVTDVFVTRDGRIFVTDYGRVRTIDDSGKVRTVFGQPTRYGDDQSPLNARFGNLDQIRISSSGNIFIADRSNSVIRKFSPTTNVTHVAGNNTANGIVLGTVAATSALRITSSAAESFDLVPGTEDIVVGQTAGAVLYRLTQSTGLWSAYTGVASGGYEIRNGDGQIGDNLNFNLNTYGITGILKIVGDKLIFKHFSGSTTPTQNVFLKGLDLSDSKRQFHLLGIEGAAASSSACANGTLLANCITNQWYRPEAAYKSSTSEYIIPDPNNNNVLRLGSSKNVYASLGKSYRGIALDVANDVIYFCAEDSGNWKIFKHDVLAATNTILAGWPAGYNCSGSSLLIDDSTGSRRVIFPVTKDGASAVSGVGAFYVP